jgi:hypothetical protein
MTIDKLQGVLDIHWWTTMKSLVLLSLSIYVGYSVVQYYQQRQVCLSRFFATTPHTKNTWRSRIAPWNVYMGASYRLSFQNDGPWELTGSKNFGNRMPMDDS